MRRYLLMVAICLAVINLVFSQKPILITDNTTSVYIGEACYVTEAITAPYLVTPSQTKPSVSNNIPLRPDTKNWIIFKINNIGKLDRSLLLHLHNAQIDTAQYIIYENDQVIFSSPITGCNMPSELRPTKDRTLSLPLSIHAGESYTVYLLVYGREFEIAITPHLVDPTAPSDFVWTNHLFILLMVFFMLNWIVSFILMLYYKKYNLPLSIIIWFLTYIFSGFMYLIATSGYGSLYIWGKLPWFEVNSPIFFGAMACFCLIELSRDVFTLKVNYPKIDKAFYFFGRFYLVCSLLGFFHYFPLFFHGFYKTLISIPYCLMLVTLITITSLSVKYFFSTGLKHFIWIMFFYLFHIAFYILILIIENNVITYNYKLHSIINVICYAPQMAIAMTFLIQKFIDGIANNEKKLASVRQQVLHTIHNDVGESLAKISMSAFLLSNSSNMNIDIKQKLEKIYEESGKADAQLKQFYFAIHTGIDKFEDLQLYFKAYMEAFWSGLKMNLLFEISPPDEDYRVGEVIKNHLLKIIKEINNNIAKHAVANEVFFYFNMTGKNQYTLMIKDNGVGFNMALENSKLSHGLNGLEYRANLINATLEIESEPGFGTTIKIKGML